MSTCTRCGVTIEDGDLLPGGEVYAKMAGGDGREDILSTYGGVKYGSATICCAECLDTPSECDNCDGSGEYRGKINTMRTTRNAPSVTEQDPRSRISCGTVVGFDTAGRANDTTSGHNGAGNNPLVISYNR